MYKKTFLIYSPLSLQLAFASEISFTVVNKVDNVVGPTISDIGFDPA